MLRACSPNLATGTRIILCLAYSTPVSTTVQNSVALNCRDVCKPLPPSFCFWGLNDQTPQIMANLRQNCCFLGCKPPAVAPGCFWGNSFTWFMGILLEKIIIIKKSGQKLKGTKKENPGNAPTLYLYHFAQTEVQDWKHLPTGSA